MAGGGIPIVLTKEEDPRFMGRKNRRRSSAYKRFLGDHLQLQESLTVLKTLSLEGDRRVCFSGLVMKVNRRYKMQERVLVVTDLAVYNMDPRTYKVKRRIPLTHVSSVSLSPFADNFFAIHVDAPSPANAPASATGTTTNVAASPRVTEDNGGDYLLVSGRKTEIVVVLLENVLLTHERLLRVLFVPNFEWRIDTGDTKEVRFVQEEGGVLTQIVSKKDGVQDVLC